MSLQEGSDLCLPQASVLDLITRLIQETEQQTSQTLCGSTITAGSRRGLIFLLFTRRSPLSVCLCGWKNFTFYFTFYFRGALRGIEGAPTLARVSEGIGHFGVATGIVAKIVVFSPMRPRAVPVTVDLYLL